MTKRFVLLLLAFIGLQVAGLAQSQARVVPDCGNWSYTVRTTSTLTMDRNGRLCTSSSGSSSSSGDVNLTKIGGNSLTTTLPVSGSVTATQATGTNLHTVTDSGTLTAVTTVGTITNPVTVTDGAGALNVIVDSGTTTVTQGTASNLKTAATLDAETTKVIGTVRNLGNAGATLDSTVGAGTAPTNQMVVGGVYNSTELSPTTGQAMSFQFDAKARLRNVIMDAAGNTRGANVDANNNLGVVLAAETTKVIGTVNMAAAQTIATTNAGTFATQAQLTPVTSGGLTNYPLEPAASDNHAVIKNGAGQVYYLHMFNNSATINYVRFYNAGTGFNGCNSATNLVWEGHIPASTSDAGFVVDIANGLAFSTGISICVTGAYGQTNTTNATASAISLNVGYK